MGVLGLTTFIDNHPHLLTEVNLHSTRIVIDGNNLFHFIYYYFNVDYLHGGNYDTFTGHVRFFFDAFKKCDVTPFVVFDGGRDGSDRKLKTDLNRAKQRIHSNDLLAHGARGRLLPLLTHMTFRFTLDELGVHHVTCDFEADDHIAALAAKWNCPVLTNDSDFFIHNLPGGVILLDYFNLELKSIGGDENSMCLVVQMYFVNCFLKNYKLSGAKLMPLFATLLGNDYFDSTLIESFYASRKFTKDKSQKAPVSRRQVRITGILRWLESVSDVEHAVESVVSNVHTENKTTIQRKIENSILSYLEPTTSLHLYFEDNQKEICNHECEIKTVKGKCLPQWFVAKWRRGHFPSLLSDVLTTQRIILKSQIELVKQPSAYETSSKLRCIVYGAMSTLDEHKAINCCDDSKFVIVEYDREHKQLKKNTVKPAVEMNLENVYSYRGDDKVEMLLRPLDIGRSLLRELPEDVQLIALCWVYWLTNSTPLLSETHLIALLLSFLKLYVIDKLHKVTQNKTFTLPEDHIRLVARSKMLREVEERCTAKDLAFAAVNLGKFTQKDTSSSYVHGGLVHVLSQFQGCVREITTMNELLLLPLPPVNPAHVLNGTFICHFHAELSKRTNPKLYIEEILGRSSYLAELFVDLLAVIKSHLPAELFTVQEKTRSKKKKKTLKTTSDRDETKESDEEAKATQVHHQLACDVANRFDCLLQLD